MIKTITLILTIAIYLSSSAQGSLLDSYLEQAKQSYREHSNKKVHQTIKSTRNIQSYQLGDQKTFWKWSLTVMPPQDVQVTATCRAVGEHSYVFVEDAEWGTSMSQTDVDEILFRLEEETLNSSEMGIVEMDTTFFGPVPDELDGDEKVIFFYSKLGSYGSSVFDGYFSAYNQMTDAESMSADGKHSNECEMLYMSCNPVNPTSESSMAVLSHELQHLIHFGIDPDEDTWVDEACAEYAMVLYGAPDQISSFPDEPNDNLIEWSQAWSDYIQSMMFFVYLSEHYGGSDFIQDIVENQDNSYTGINNALASNGFSQDFTEVFKDWTNANYIDAPELEDNKYNYSEMEIPDFSLEYTFTSASESSVKTLNSCAAHYMNIYPQIGSFTLNLEAVEEANWDINLILFENDIAKQIINSPNAHDLFYSEPTDFTPTKIILVIRNNDLTTGSEKDYKINLTSSGTNVIEINSNIEARVYPNPFNNILNINLNTSVDSNTSVAIYNTNGELIKELYNNKLSSGVSTIQWNAEKQKAGIYYIRIIQDNKVKNIKAVLY